MFLAERRTVSVRDRRSAAGLAVACALLIPTLAGCIDNPKWNRQERQSLEASVERIKKAAETSKAEPPRPVVPRPPGTPLKGDVRLTLRETLRLALLNSQDIQSTGFDPLLAETDLVKATAVYDPSVFLNNDFGRTDRPIQNTLDTGTTRAATFIEDTYAFKGGFKQRTPTGGTFSIYQEGNTLNSNSELVVPNPQWVTRGNAELAQPLLRGWGDAVNQGAIKVANLNIQVSLQDFRQKVMEVTAKVVAAYWQVAFDQESARITRRSLEQAQEVLRRETARKGQGLSNELDISRAASAVGSRQAELIRAENRAKNSGDQLKRLLHAPELPVDGEAVIIPADQPRFFIVDADRTAAMSRALSRRPELERARNALAINQVRIDVADRERLPRLDAALRYTLNALAPEFHEAIRKEDPGRRVSWSAGLEFEMPIGNRAAIADYQRRRIEYEQSLRDASQLVDQVMTEVSAAVRAVIQGRDEVEFTLRAKTAAEKLVKAEFVRFELGGVSNDELLRSQDTQAAADRDHLLAILNFNLALTELARAEGTLLEERGIEIIWPEEKTARPAPLSVRLPPEEPKPAPDEKPPAQSPLAQPSAPAGQAPKPAAPAATGDRPSPPQSPQSPAQGKPQATPAGSPGPPAPPSPGARAAGR
jgi:outer membrane protein TolC